MPVNKTKVQHSSLDILEALVAIESVNPAFGPPASGEGEVATYLEQRCHQTGLNVSRQRVTDGRDNIIIELRQNRSPENQPRPTLLLQTHMDTVALGGMANPLNPLLRDGKLYGRGACDAKGSLASMLGALESVAAERDQLTCDVVLCAAVDEEHRFQGVLRFLESGTSVTGAVVGEPTDMQIVVAHKGVCRFAVQTQGVAAHTSLPNKGNSAIRQMNEVLNFIRDVIEPDLQSMIHPLCGAPTIVVATINGGTQINIVPESCEIQIDRRVIPGENSREVLNDFETRLKQFACDRDIRFTIRELLLDEPLNTSNDAEIVHSAQRCAETLGLSIKIRGVPYGSDASKLQAIGGIPSIVFGPGSISQAHSRDEYVPVSEVEQATNFYAELMRTFGTPANKG